MTDKPAVCPHCKLPPVLPDKCTPEIQAVIEEHIRVDGEMFYAGMQHEARHHIVAPLMTEDPDTTRRQLEYLRMAMRRSLGLPPDAPDEDIIDHAAERWTPKCDHAWTLIMRLDHCEIDAEDPIPHTAIVLLGCPKCRSVQAFPPPNAALITPRYRAIIRKDLERQHWVWPEEDAS